jgi:CRISPR-associated protein Cas2
MELLVAYDIATDTAAGEVRLRKVAAVCQAYGQRVQKSVFECIVNEVQAEQLKRDLERVIDRRKDSIRIYRLREPRDRFVWLAGRQLRYDLHRPLVLWSSADDE